MKELLALIQAITRARSALTSYAEGGQRFPDETLKELADVLCSDEVRCALEKIQMNVGSPPIAPEDSPSKNESMEA